MHPKTFWLHDNHHKLSPHDKIQHLTPQIKTVTGWNLLWDSLQWPVARREPTQAATSRKGLPVSATPRKVDSPTCRRLLLPVSFGKSCAFPQSVSHNVRAAQTKVFAQVGAGLKAKEEGSPLEFQRKDQARRHAGCRCCARETNLNSIACGFVLGNSRVATANA